MAKWSNLTLGLSNPSPEAGGDGPLREENGAAAPQKKPPTTHPGPISLSLSLFLFFSLLTFGRWHCFLSSSWRDANLLFSSFRCLIARFKHTDLLCISKWGKWRRGLIFGLAAFFRKENTPKYKADNLPYLQKAKSGKEPGLPPWL